MYSNGVTPATFSILLTFVPDFEQNFYEHRKPEQRAHLVEEA